MEKLVYRDDMSDGIRPNKTKRNIDRQTIDWIRYGEFV